MNKTLIFIIFILLPAVTWGQSPKPSFFDLPDTLVKKRLYISAGTGVALYTGASIALWEAWYKNSETGGFQTIDDRREWLQMDKGGHIFSTWAETYYAFKGAQWTGMKRRNAIIVATSIGLGIQTTIEVMDGFSKDWGWSWSDLAANGLGSAVFVSQELMWQEQRIKLKVSAQPKNYSTDPVFSQTGEGISSAAGAASTVFGESMIVSFLKDYNAQTIWASVNIHDFMREESKFPRWLNVAVGYGAENVFGAYSNSWQEGNDSYVLPSGEYPRYRQVFLSFDVDLSKLKIKNKFLRALVGAVNWIKIPSPTLEYNGQGNFIFHPIFW